MCVCLARVKFQWFKGCRKPMALTPKDGGVRSHSKPQLSLS